MRDTVHARSGDDIGDEEGQPTNDEHAHNGAQSFGGLVLLLELGQLTGN